MGKRSRCDYGAVKDFPGNAMETLGVKFLLVLGDGLYDAEFSCVRGWSLYLIRGG